MESFRGRASRAVRLAAQAPGYVFSCLTAPLVPGCAVLEMPGYPSRASAAVSRSTSAL